MAKTEIKDEIKRILCMKVKELRQKCKQTNINVRENGKYKNSNELKYNLICSSIDNIDDIEGEKKDLKKLSIENFDIIDKKIKEYVKKYPEKKAKKMIMKLAKQVIKTEEKKMEPELYKKYEDYFIRENKLNPNKNKLESLSFKLFTYEQGYKNFKENPEEKQNLINSKFYHIESDNDEFNVVYKDSF